jgi:hypothetical protein
MWAAVGILAVGGIIAYIEIPSLLRAKLYREIGAFGLLLLLGMTMGILETMDVRLPNPLDWITAIHKPISDMIFGG